MPGSAVIGALRVVLGADTAALEKGLKNSQSKVAAFGAALTTGMAAAAAAVAAAGIAIGTAVNRTIDDFDKLSKTSQKIGIPVEQLSALAYAADLSDVSFEALTKGVGKLSKAMVEAAGKPTSEAANAFRALGVSVTDSSGKLKSSDVIMADIADKFADLKDGAGKTAVSMALFGKAGADLIPLLNGGRDSLREMNDEAKQFGAIVSTRSAKEAENFNDNMTRLGYAIKGVFVQVSSQLLPGLVDISNRMVESAKSSSLLEISITVLSTAMKGLVTAGVLVGATLQVTADALAIIWGGLARLMKGDVAGAFENLKKKAGDIAGTASGTMAALDTLWKGAKAGADGAAVSTDGATKSQKDFNYAAMAGKNAVDEFLASQAKKNASQTAELATIGKSVGEQAKLRLELQALAIAKEKLIPITETLRGKISAAGDAAAAMAMKLQGAQLIEQTAMPWDQRAQQVGQYAAAMTAAGASTDQLGLMMAKIQFPAFTSASIAATDLGLQLDQLAAGAVNGLSNALVGVVMGTKKAGEAFKAFALQVIADLAAMIIKLLLFKVIRMAVLGFSDGGMVSGGGLSLTGTGGLYAEGGLVTGPGTGTSDSIPARLSAGEFVMPADMTKQYLPMLSAMRDGSLEDFVGGGNPVSARGSQAPARGTTMVYIDAALRPLAEALFPHLNAAIRDGHELKLATI